MSHTSLLEFIHTVLKNMPNDWLTLTTHRLDIYNEEKAKTGFLEQFQELYTDKNISKDTLEQLPTAYDYIRLGHPLSSVLEWTIAQQLNIKPSQVISFSSQTTGILAVLRQNAQDQKKTRILYSGELPQQFNADVIRAVYELSLIHI